MALYPTEPSWPRTWQYPIYAEDLKVFDLATGTERSWTTRACSRCVPISGGMLWFGVDSDALSWTADSQHVRVHLG